MYQCQECLVTTQTKKVVKHSPTNAYLLNTHALHNYWKILAVLPPDLCKQFEAATVMDHNSLCLHAVELLCTPKSTEGGHIPADSAVNTSKQPAPAIDKVTKLETRTWKASKTMKMREQGKTFLSHSRSCHSMDFQSWCLRGSACSNLQSHCIKCSTLSIFCSVSNSGPLLWSGHLEYSTSSAILFNFWAPAYTSTQLLCNAASLWSHFSTGASNTGKLLDWTHWSTPTHLCTCNFRCSWP